MPKPLPELLKYFLSDCLEENRSYTTKPMMGGYCIYKHWKIFAIYAMDMIYFKTHENNLKDFQDIWAKQFEFEKKDGSIARMCYYLLPEEILDDREKLNIWIEKALDY